MVALCPHRMADQVIEHLCGAVDRGPNAVQHLYHSGSVDTVGDFQRGELRVFQNRREEVLIDQIGFGAEFDAGHAGVIDQAFLETAPGRLGRSAIGDIGEQ